MAFSEKMILTATDVKEQAQEYYTMFELDILLDKYDTYENSI